MDSNQQATISGEEWKKLCEVMNGYVYSQILVTACEFDLFTHLSNRRRGSTQDEVQKDLSLSPYATRVLLLGCCAAGLIYRDEETSLYFNSNFAGKVLTSESEDSMIPFVFFNHQVQRRCGTHFTQALKENRNAGLDEFPGDGTTLYQRLTGYPDLEKLFQKGMGAYTRLSPKMLDVPEFSGIKQLLDVGGGDGTNAIRLCLQYPNLKVTLLDTPSVCEIAHKKIADAELGNRISCVA